MSNDEVTEVGVKELSVFAGFTNSELLRIREYMNIEDITVDDLVRNKPMVIPNTLGASVTSEPGAVVKYTKPDPNERFLVLHITTGYGKRYTCKTVGQLAEFVSNYKRVKNRKRDEDVPISLGWGRMSQQEYEHVPECEFFSK